MTATATGWTFLAVFAAPDGCHPPAPPVAASTEVRLWLYWHGFRPDEKVADICARLDRLGRAELQAFDRGSPSRVGYRDVRADRLGLVAKYGGGIAVRDFGAARADWAGPGCAPVAPRSSPAGNDSGTINPHARRGLSPGRR